VQWLIDLGKLAGVIAALIAAVTLIAKSPVGRLFGWVYSRLFGEPVLEKFTEAVNRTVTPHLDRLEAKNDAQHSENAARLAQNAERLVELHAAVEALRKSIRETRIEDKLEVRDQLFELSQQAKKHYQLLEAHFDESERREERITALELRNADVHITVGPKTDEVPIVEPEPPEPPEAT
jgi:hypothetical protein